MNPDMLRPLRWTMLLAAPLMMVWSAGGIAQDCASAGPREVAIQSDAGSNGGVPLAVDIVFVTEEAAWQELSQMAAADYFERRAQLGREFPGGFVTSSFEVVPGQQIGGVGISWSCESIGAIVFANYSSASDHRLSVGDAEAGTIFLGEEDFSWTPS
jgi:hypothetical protein